MTTPGEAASARIGLLMHSTATLTSVIQVVAGRLLMQGEDDPELEAALDQLDRVYLMLYKNLELVRRELPSDLAEQIPELPPPPP